MYWVGAILESIREMECPCCGARLASCAVRRITAEPNTLVVRLACAVCGENSLAVARRDQTTTTQPISRDEVLDAHEFLGRWHGRVTDVLAPRAA